MQSFLLQQQRLLASRPPDCTATQLPFAASCQALLCLETLNPISAVGCVFILDLQLLDRCRRPRRVRWSDRLLVADAEDALPRASGPGGPGYLSNGMAISLWLRVRPALRPTGIYLVPSSAPAPPHSVSHPLSWILLVTANAHSLLWHSGDIRTCVPLAPCNKFSSLPYTLPFLAREHLTTCLLVTHPQAGASLLPPDTPLSSLRYDAHGRTAADHVGSCHLTDRHLQHPHDRPHFRPLLHDKAARLGRLLRNRRLGKCSSLLSCHFPPPIR